MNRIVIVTSEFGKQGGGLSNSCFKFVQLLISIDFEVKVVISSNNTDKEKNRVDDCDIIVNSVHITKGGYKSDLHKHLFFRAHISNVYEQLKDIIPTAIIAFGGGENSLFASEINKYFNTKLIIMLRGSEINLAISDSSLYYSNYESLKNASVVVGLTNELIDRAKQIYFNPNNIYLIIPNSIDFKQHISTSRNENNVIIGVGARNINEKKGIANLIHALSHLNTQSNINFKLKIAGEIDNDLHIIYKELANSLKVNNDIIFLGNLTKELFYKEMKQWDLVVQSSFCEGFSNTIGEAIGIGKPFITTNTGFIAEQIKDKFPELVFDNFSPEHMANKILKTFRSGELQKQSIEAAEYMKPLVTNEVVKQHWVSLFEKLKLKKPFYSISIQHILSVILHDISEKNYSNIDIPKVEFEKLCNLVYSKGFRFVSAKEYFSSEKKDNLIICTFDDSYQGVYDLGFPILKKYGFTATIFVCSDYINITNSWNKKDKSNRNHLDLESLKQLQNNFWEIGSHGTNHFSFLRLDEKQLLRNLEESKKELEFHFENVVSFAYPYGDYNPFIAGLTRKLYKNIFVVDSGGTHIFMDRHQIRRYSTDELIKILNV
jgi:glycosyltransferase involved in cell wall biosynthesis/peptidoglycan/xylan/chitin deacetylase (PgdA/CDA1 family)